MYIYVYADESVSGEHGLLIGSELSPRGSSLPCSQIRLRLRLQLSSSYAILLAGE
ncbi:hypothetical protein CBSLWZGG_CDS148 [Pseudomonas phage PseuPha1]|uniref:Uncharacterized protein n=1 Tax=Pseudomonas phage PhL_UNISO_PA-DSM_ph0034 TaxID=2812900 RepID=A0A9E6Q9P1_9CAUD|nr:hypothetical protein QE329_gp004 [Pseudomonas phage PhL_UNISO_PA-DSM_ph0034]QYC95124.1 hypothetical protein [Pseudomonas phage PhL_UNISO_PA-DSM_ph0034]UZO33241.1 hypothetical protein CBSLWZGG_CDS148 [Pseudomonas phage PseuPha1]